MYMWGGMPSSYPELDVSNYVDGWVSEKKDYHYSSNSCSGMCGHYTQVMNHIFLFAHKNNLDQKHDLEHIKSNCKVQKIYINNNQSKQIFSHFALHDIT